LGSLLVASSAMARETESNDLRRVNVFATLPDWSGIWESEAWSSVDISGRPAGGLAELRAKSALAVHPPYNAEWEARYRDAVKAFDEKKSAEIMKICEFGFPGVLESPALFQIFVTPEQTVFLFATREARHVYTDGRSHPDAENIWPTLMGDSIG